MELWFNIQPWLRAVAFGLGCTLHNTTLFSFFNSTTVIYGGNLFFIEYNNSQGEPVICVDFSMNGMQITNTTIIYYSYPQGFFILTYLGCSLSVIGCALVLLTYTLFSELRTFPSRLLMNLTVAILVTNLLILLGGPITWIFS